MATINRLVDLHSRTLTNLRISQHTLQDRVEFFKARVLSSEVNEWAKDQLTVEAIDIKNIWSNRSFGQAVMGVIRGA